jgi:hypothetical protein
MVVVLADLFLQERRGIGGEGVRMAPMGWGGTEKVKEVRERWSKTCN